MSDKKYFDFYTFFFWGGGRGGETGFRIIRIKMTCEYFEFNPLPNDRILEWLKLKAFADDKLNVTEK